jgi:hypothetical protein
MYSSKITKNLWERITHMKTNNGRSSNLINNSQKILARPSYARGKDGKIMVLGNSMGKKLVRPYLKNKEKTKQSRAWWYRPRY